MVASGYMTETDTESIWNTTIETARFTKINIRIAEQLNFWCNDNATTQVTSAAVTPVLEQISEEILFDLMASAKIDALQNPWDFIQANVIRISWRILRNYDIILNKIRTILGNEKMEITTSRLPSSTSNW